MPLEHEVMLIWKKFHFFSTEIFGFCVDLRSDNDMKVDYEKGESGPD